MICLSKNTRKDMTDTIKHFEQQTSSTHVFCLVSCSSKIKFHISKLWPTQIWHVCCSEKKKKIKMFKKTHLGQVFQSVTSFETRIYFFLALRNKQKYKYTNNVQVMLNMRLMSKGEYLIVPKGTKFTGAGKLGLRVTFGQNSTCGTTGTVWWKKKLC